MIPAYVAALSAMLFLLHLILTSRPVRRFIAKIYPARYASIIDEEETEVVQEPPQHTGFLSDIKYSVKKHGVAVFLLKVLRLLSCLALLGISMAAFIILEETDDSTSGHALTSGWKHRHKSKKHKHRDARRRAALHHHEWIELVQCVFYVREIM